MKFDQPRSIGGGLWILLRDDAGTVVGGISCHFQTNRQGVFTSNQQPGYLKAVAKVTDPATGEQSVVAEWSNSTCRRRADAEKAFRTWVRENDIRAKVIAAAEKFQTPEG